VKDGDHFCMVGLPGGQVICTVTPESMASWRAGGVLAVDFPKRIGTTQQGELQLSPMHPLRSQQAQIEARDVAVEIIGEVTGNCGSCTDAESVFTFYRETVGKWQALLSGIVIPQRSPIQLVKG
jgi:hypothetical protein